MKQFNGTFRGLLLPLLVPMLLAREMGRCPLSTVQKDLRISKASIRWRTGDHLMLHKSNMPQKATIKDSHLLILSRKKLSEI
jgi:hypothetical protein